MRGQGKLLSPLACWWSPYFLPWWDRLVARPQQRRLKDQHPLAICGNSLVQPTSMGEPPLIVLGPACREAEKCSREILKSITF